MKPRCCGLRPSGAPPSAPRASSAPPAAGACAAASAPPPPEPAAARRASGAACRPGLLHRSAKKSVDRFREAGNAHSASAQQRVLIECSAEHSAFNCPATIQELDFPSSQTHSRLHTSKADQQRSRALSSGQARGGPRRSCARADRPLRSARLRPPSPCSPAPAGAPSTVSPTPCAHSARTPRQAPRQPGRVCKGFSAAAGAQRARRTAPHLLGALPAGRRARRIGYLPARRRVRACKASCGASSVDIHVHTRNVHPVRDKVKRVGRHAKAKLHCHAMQPRSNKFARHPAAHARAAPPGTNVAACALSSGQRPDTPSPPLPRPAASV